MKVDDQTAAELRQKFARFNSVNSQDYWTEAH